MLIFSFLSLFIFVCCSYNVFVSSGSYCLFLVSLSVISSILVLLLNNSFWYSLILLIIYIGGVYVLLLFVSIYSYNSFSYSNTYFIFFISVSFYIYFIFNYLNNSFIILNFSPLLVSLNESLELVSSNNWESYLFILLFILFSFFIFSFVFTNNSNYIR
uniref:NADH dehydrogenase subunit 6 n=1 Tax=Paragyrodactylus variegatus TaxID=1415179 RepID=A0A076VA16_9PLAT|nr:NADH dehydrogenase subunit 6 [Paragyrodactylus variegatus]AIK25768.1 NADH dehydrogenase subunit 6 [Paragyrodactylus variegatus]